MKNKSVRKIMEKNIAAAGVIEFFFFFKIMEVVIKVDYIYF